MKKIILFISGAVFFLILSVLLSSYGNKFAHKNFNEYMIMRFEKLLVNPTTPFAKFRDYDFNWNSDEKLPGEAVTKGGYEFITTKEVDKNARDWVIHGGYSADEPELHASFRHFYDPTAPALERHLKDHLDLLETFLSDYGFFNPRIDHVDWATSHPEHDYNWDNGKSHFELALSDPDFAKKDQHMAFAMRALGETLHMIADMGCPAHVRDDSHPSVKGGEGIYKHFGSPDPYEEIFEKLVHRFAEFSQGAVDRDMTKIFQEAPIIQRIAGQLATYTNENFFTEQTIKGTDVVQRIHKDKVYPTPDLDDLGYDEDTYYYSSSISGHTVLMCRDLKFDLSELGLESPDIRGYPYLDSKCVESQAKALVPQILDAGANAIRLFFPEISIVIDEVTEEKIKGRVIHKPDSEYKTPILYNGTVGIIKANNLDVLDEIVCVEGNFEANLDLPRSFDPEKDQLMADIMLGGLRIKSRPFYTQGSSGKFEMVIEDLESGIRIDTVAERCSNINFKLSFPSGTPDSYYYSMDFGNESRVFDYYIRPEGASEVYSYYEPGTYKVVATLMDDQKNILEQVEAEIKVKQNDFLEALTTMTKVTVGQSWGPDLTFEGDKGHWAKFNYYWTSIGPDTEIEWTGRNFDFHQMCEDRELRITGTLSEDCWMVEHLHCTFTIDNSYTSELTMGNLSVWGYESVPCPGVMDKTEMHYECPDPENNITFMSASIKGDLHDDKWYDFISVDWSTVDLGIKFSK